jgi:hypothetical protein
MFTGNRIHVQDVVGESSTGTARGGVIAGTVRFVSCYSRARNIPL